MAMMMTYRQPTRKEQTIIRRALARWGVFDVLKDSTFIVREDKTSRGVYIVTSELWSASMHLTPLFCGLAIGVLAKHFHPTLEGADLFARLSGGGRNYVMVDDNGVKLVLYGRDVMGNSVIKAADLLENETVIITNSAGQALGIGRTRFAGKWIMQKGRITLTTITDAGRYLREEDGERPAKISRLSR